MNATRPKERAIRLYEACKESLEVKFPLSNNVNIIGSASKTKPITAGTLINSVNLMAQSKVLEKAVLSSLINNPDNRGNMTVPIAMANIHKGNCISLSETYNQLGLPVGNSDARIVSTSILIWLTPPAIIPGIIK